MILSFSLGHVEAVVGIIWDTKHENIVMGRKKPGNFYFSGRLHIPGEKIKRFECDRKALARLGKEELSIGLTVIRYLARHTNPLRVQVRWYECQAKTDILTPGSDLFDAAWVPHLEVPSKHLESTVLLWPDKIKEFFKVPNSPAPHEPQSGVEKSPEVYK